MFTFSNEQYQEFTEFLAARLQQHWQHWPAQEDWPKFEEMPEFTLLQCRENKNQYLIMTFQDRVWFDYYGDGNPICGKMIKIQEPTDRRKHITKGLLWILVREYVSLDFFDEYQVPEI